MHMHWLLNVSEYVHNLPYLPSLFGSCNVTSKVRRERSILSPAWLPECHVICMAGVEDTTVPDTGEPRQCFFIMVELAVGPLRISK